MFYNVMGEGNEVVLLYFLRSNKKQLILYNPDN